MERITLDQAAENVRRAVQDADHRLDLAVDLADSAYLRAYRLAATQGGRGVSSALIWANRHWPVFMPAARPWPRTTIDAEHALAATPARIDYRPATRVAAEVSA